MKESSAWRLIAKERHGQPKKFRRAGLCYQVMSLYQRKLISHPTAKWMLSRIYHQMPWNEKTGRFGVHAYHKQDQRYADGGRILAAIWLGLEAKAEEIDARDRTPKP